jgi:hypothetical protein
MLLPLAPLLPPLLLSAAAVRRAILTDGCSCTSCGVSTRSCRWRKIIITLTPCVHMYQHIVHAAFDNKGMCIMQGLACTAPAAAPNFAPAVMMSG